MKNGLNDFQAHIMDLATAETVKNVANLGSAVDRAGLIVYFKELESKAFIKERMR